MAEEITAVPINKVGIEKGKTIIALKMADFPKEGAAPIAPSKLIKKVPKIRLKIIGKKLLNGKNNIKKLIIEAIKIGNPVTSQ